MGLGYDNRILVFNNGFLIQYLFRGLTNSWSFNWIFPTSFSSTNYSVQVTHEDEPWSRDRTTRFTGRTVSEVLIGGNQHSDLWLSALAIGY